MGSPEAFAEFTGALDGPMLVATTADGERRAGCLVGFATQCSIDPPRFLACLSRANHTTAVARSAEVVVVHALGAGQRGLAELFGTTSGDEVDKFASCSWRPGPGGAPVLLDCPNWLAGRILGRFDLGDHVGFWLEPVEVSFSWGGRPLCLSAVKDLEPGHRA